MLVHWNKYTQPGRVLGADGGYFLPIKAVRAADVSWVSNQRLAALPPVREEKGFPSVCPDFVVEVRSRSDNLETLQAKMGEWLANGTRLGWLVDSWEPQVHIYRPSRPVEAQAGLDFTLSGGDVLPGFSLTLSELGLE